MQSRIPPTIKQLEIVLKESWIRTILDDDGCRWVYLRDVDTYIGIARPDFLVEDDMLQSREVWLGNEKSTRLCIYLPRLTDYFKSVDASLAEAECIYDHIESTWREWMGIGVVRDVDGPVRQTYKMVFANMLEVLGIYGYLYNVQVGEPYVLDTLYLYRMLLAVIKRGHHVDYDDLSNMELIALSNVISMFTAMLLNYIGDKDLQQLTPISGVIETLLYKLRDVFDMADSIVDVVEDVTPLHLKEAELLYNKD